MTVCSKPPAYHSISLIRLWIYLRQSLKSVKCYLLRNVVINYETSALLSACQFKYTKTYKRLRTFVSKLLMHRSHSAEQAVFKFELFLYCFCESTTCSLSLILSEFCRFFNKSRSGLGVCLPQAAAKQRGCDESESLSGKYSQLNTDYGAGKHCTSINQNYSTFASVF